MIRRPPRSTLDRSSAASDVYKRQVDPLRDKEIVDTELILKDIETQEKRIDKIRKQSKGGDKEIFKELGIAEELLKHLEQGKPARSFITDEETAAYVKATQLLTGKPVSYTHLTLPTSDLV